MPERWKKTFIPLPKTHGWRTTKPSNSLFVAHRGAVSFEFPREWEITPTGKGTLMLRDNPYPDENMRIEVALIQLYNADGTLVRQTNTQVEWEHDLKDMFEEMMRKDPREMLALGKLREAFNPEFELLWQQFTHIDREENRKVHTRTCFARANGVHAIITFDFWPEYSSQANRVWREMLATMKVGEYISDPTLSAKMN